MQLKRSSVSSTNILRARHRRSDINLGRIRTFIPYLKYPLIVVLVILLSKSLFRLKFISCIQDGQICGEKINSILERYKQKSILTINKKEIEQEIEKTIQIKKISISFLSPSSIEVSIESEKSFIPQKIYLVQSLPKLTMDLYDGSTNSSWYKPTDEIKAYLSSQIESSYRLWDIGEITLSSDSGQTSNMVFSEKPSTQTLKNIYSVLTLATKYLQNFTSYIIESRILLSRENQPDIIITVPVDSGELEQSLQSLPFLYTIKEDTKVIDLSFKNPIIR